VTHRVRDASELPSAPRFLLVKLGRTVLVLTETGALVSDYKARGFWVTELDHKPTLNPRKRYFLVNHSDSGGLRAWPEWKLEERLEEIGIEPSP
jgi:hypothetical protein